MNILFFLTPKSEVAYINEDDTIRQALEKMEYHKYSAVPIISKTGRYVGTLTEGDLLWGIKNQFNLDLKGAEKIPVTAVRRKSDNRPVKAGEDMEDLIGKALNQNFVPVLDDQKCFIGIITRKDIIKYLYQKCQNLQENPEKTTEKSRLSGISAVLQGEVPPPPLLPEGAGTLKTKGGTAIKGGSALFMFGWELMRKGQSFTVFSRSGHRPVTYYEYYKDNQG